MDCAAQVLLDALSRKAGSPIPWPVVRAAISGALQANYLARTLDSAPWPADAANAGAVRLRMPTHEPVTAVTPSLAPVPAPQPGTYHAQAELVSHEIQNLAECIDDLLTSAVGHDLRFTLQIDTDGPLPSDVV